MTWVWFCSNAGECGRPIKELRHIGCLAQPMEISEYLLGPSKMLKWDWVPNGFERFREARYFEKAWPRRADLNIAVLGLRC